MATAQPTPATTNATPLVTQPVQAFMKANGFTTIVPAVRANSNGYHYVTFINDQNVSENVYFSKGASATVVEGQVIAKGFFDQFEAAETVNLDGELRNKLVTKRRASLDELF